MVSHLFSFKVLFLDILCKSAATIKRWEHVYYIIILALNADLMLCWSYLFCIISDFDLKGRKILSENMKVEGSEQQIKFNGSPFIILGKSCLTVPMALIMQYQEKNGRLKKK